MKALHSENGIYYALQLIKIAQMECTGKVDAKSAVVIGDNVVSNALVEIIGCDAISKTEDIDKLAPQRKFNAIFIFTEIEEDLLQCIAETDAVVIDMTEYKSEETVCYSCSVPYSRIRVVSLFEDEIN